MNTDDLRRVLAEHENLGPEMTGMIGRIRQGAQRQARRRRRTAATSAVAAVAAIAVTVPLTLMNPDPGRPVGNSPATTPPPDRPDEEPLLVTPLTVGDSPDGPRVTRYQMSGVVLNGDFGVNAISGFDPNDPPDPPLTPIQLPNGTGYADESPDGTAALYWQYAPGKWAEAYGADLSTLVPLSSRVRDQPRPMRFPYHLDYLAGLSPHVVYGYEVVGTDESLVSRLEITVGRSCSSAKSTPSAPPEARCEPGATRLCDPPAAFPNADGSDVATPADPSVFPGDCREAPDPGFGGTVTVKVGDSRLIDDAVPEGNGRWRIRSPDRAGLAVERGGFVVSVTTARGFAWPSGEDEIERVMDGLTVLPIDNRSAWTDDPLP